MTITRPAEKPGNQTTPITRYRLIYSRGSIEAHIHQDDLFHVAQALAGAGALGRLLKVELLETLK